MLYQAACGRFRNIHLLYSRSSSNYSPHHSPTFRAHAPNESGTVFGRYGPSQLRLDGVQPHDAGEQLPGQRIVLGQIGQSIRSLEPVQRQFLGPAAAAQFFDQIGPLLLQNALRRRRCSDGA